MPKTKLEYPKYSKRGKYSKWVCPVCRKPIKKGDKIFWNRDSEHDEHWTCHTNPSPDGGFSRGMEATCRGGYPKPRYYTREEILSMRTPQELAYEEEEKYIYGEGSTRMNALDDAYPNITWEEKDELIRLHQLAIKHCYFG